MFGIVKLAVAIPMAFVAVALAAVRCAFSVAAWLVKVSAGGVCLLVAAMAAKQANLRELRSRQRAARELR